ncbi:MAG: hypothetical protein M5U14_09620 [Acidimicrobiia bacterium]|nr:hypothetical protein [Acidimicrobiia bacterium]
MDRVLLLLQVRDDGERIGGFLDPSNASATDGNCDAAVEANSSIA